MEARNGNGLTIDCAPSGRNGMATLTAKLGDELLAVESFNLAKPKARAGFTATICKDRPGIKREAVESELLKMAADLAAKPESPAADFGDAPELDTSRIVRPERFIMPEVSGVAVPSMTSLGDKVRGRWLLYLRWADGQREKRPLGPTLETPDGGRLWIHPEPSVCDKAENPTCRKSHHDVSSGPRQPEAEATNRRRSGCLAAVTRRLAHTSPRTWGNVACTLGPD